MEFAFAAIALTCASWLPCRGTLVPHQRHIACRSEAKRLVSQELARDSWYVKTETFKPDLPFPVIKPHLEAHKVWVNALRKNGTVITSGYRVDADGKPGGGGLMFFRAVSHAHAVALCECDPLVANGCVNWQVNGWIAEVGDIECIDGGRTNQAKKQAMRLRGGAMHANSGARALPVGSVGAAAHDAHGAHGACSAARPRSRPVSAAVHSSREGGIGWAPLTANLALQALYSGIAVLGIAVLLHPLGGPSATSLLGVSEGWNVDCANWWSAQPCAAAAAAAADAADPTAADPTAADPTATPGGTNLLLDALVQCTAGAGVALAELARLGVVGTGETEYAEGGRASNEAALCSEAGEAGASDGAPDGMSEGWLAYTAAQAVQMRPLYEIAASEGRLPLAVAAVGVWQLSLALAEELYYRGFVESAGVLALSPASAAGPAGTALREALPLLASAALFGLVHTEFVEDKPVHDAPVHDAPVHDAPAHDAPVHDAPVHNDAAASLAAPTASHRTPHFAAPSVADTKAEWFRITAAYGALYSLLYVASGHRVLAPVCAHAGLNVGLCMRDWRRMRRTPETVLAQTFAQE